MLRYGAAAAFSCLVATSALAAGCVDPQNAYDDYLSRTADARATQVTSSSGGDAEPLDGALPEGGFQGNYAMICGSQLVGDTVAQATLFVATMDFAPSGAAGDGSLTFVDTPLIAGTTNINNTAGGTAAQQTVPVTGGTCAIAYGQTTIPGSADVVEPGKQIVFADLTLHFYITSSTQICAALTGDLSLPIAQSNLQASENTCLFVPAASDGSFTLPPQSAMHCP